MTATRTRSGQQLFGAQLEAYIRAGSTKRGLDPDAVMSDVGGEGGLNGAVGDNGTSFGPFQMHWQGVMPAQYIGDYEGSKAFANSPAGVDYALDRIASVAAGLTGDAAITAIVERFERPANPSAEISRDETSGPVRPGRPTAKASGGGGGGGGVLGALSGFLGGVTGGAETAFGSAWRASLGGDLTGVLDFLKAALWLVNPKSWLRIVEFAVGIMFMVLGLIGLGVLFAQRSPAVGAAADVAQHLPGPVGAAGRAVTVTRGRAGGIRAAAGRRVPQRIAERGAEQQGRLQARHVERTKAINQARARGRRNVEANADWQRFTETAPVNDEIPF